MSGHQFADARKHRLLAAVVAEREVLRQRGFVEMSRNLRVFQQGFDLRGEDKHPAVPEVIERLDAQAIAGTEQCLARLVPDREGEHPTKTGYAVVSVLLI